MIFGLFCKIIAFSNAVHGYFGVVLLHSPGQIGYLNSDQIVQDNDEHFVTLSQRSLEPHQLMLTPLFDWVSIRE